MDVRNPRKRLVFPLSGNFSTLLVQSGPFDSKPFRPRRLSRGWTSSEDFGPRTITFSFSIEVSWKGKEEGSAV